MLKKNILIVGAYGFGNLGDDGYKAVFADYLGDEFNLFFDSPYPDLSYMDKIDYLVIGGGGLIYEYEENHLNYFKMYIDEAKKREIHYSFISCGIQIPFHVYEKTTQSNSAMAGTILNWKELLSGADLITLRATKDVEIVQELVDKPVFNFPDLCYLLKPSNYRVTGNIDLVVIPKQDNGLNEIFKKEIEEALKVQEEVFLLAFSQNDLSSVELLKNLITNHANYRSRTNLTPQEALSILKKTKRVITARYHGAVFSRVAGIPEDKIIQIKSTYKLREDIKPLYIKDAEEHIELLKEKIYGMSFKQRHW